MLRKYLLIATLLFLGGCAQKGGLDFFHSDLLYEKGLQYTVTGDIVNSFETKALINATYLNSTDPKKYDTKLHTFLVGIYITEDNEKDNEKYLANTKYTLTMNGRERNTTEELLSTHELFEHIPLKNPHAKYYIIGFEKKSNEAKLELQYQNTHLGKTILSFQAE